LTDAASEADAWEGHAAWWQEEFTEGVDPEYVEQILPLAVEWTAGAGRVLEVGCGEGQVARAIAAAADAAVARVVVGADPTANQVTEAVRRARGPVYLRAPASPLPFADATFDAVVVCLVLEHVDDLDGALGEIGRILQPGGRLVLMLNHPLLQAPGSGWIDDQVLDPPEQYWRIGSYLTESANVEEVERDVFIRFLHRPLHRYVNGLLAAGLRIERLLEPAPPQGFLARAPEYPDAADIPRLMVLVAAAPSAPTA
jgi:SAM-dependent methyltransferase